MNQKDNLTTKNIKEFTAGDTIYTGLSIGGISVTALTEFEKLEKGVVFGKILDMPGHKDLYRYIGSPVKVRVDKCSLYGLNPSSKRRYYHYFNSQGYALHPLEVHKVSRSGDLIVSEHPAYGLLQAHRVSSGKPSTLFGSSIKSGNTIVVTLNKAEYDRSINHDSFHSRERIFEVEMSQNQFAEFITSLNYGSGVPCTIRYMDNKVVPEPNFQSKIEVFQNEFKNILHNIGVDLNILVSSSMETLKNKDYLSKKDREDVIKSIEALVQNIQKNIPYFGECFNKQMDKTVTEAKSEVEAFIANKIGEVGLKAMGSLNVSMGLNENYKNLDNNEKRK